MAAYVLLGSPVSRVLLGLLFVLLVLGFGIFVPVTILVFFLSVLIHFGILYNQKSLI